MIMIKNCKSGVAMLLLIFCFLTGYAQPSEDPIREIEKHRQEQEAEFRDEAKSPLTAKERRHFKHLNFYPIDLKYRINAKFTKTDTPVFFKMKTTTERLPEYSKFGEITFSIDSQQHKLEVYFNKQVASMPGYEDYLFIPFTDLTNGEDTYEVGRYLELRIPNTEDVVLDFNLCYNPYCSYGGKYSCPIPPEANHLNVSIPAGEKKYNH
jgi:uncharacterized protein (DUF1684 family)